MSLRPVTFAGLQILFAFSLKVLKRNDKPETIVFLGLFEVVITNTVQPYCMHVPATYNEHFTESNEYDKLA